MPYSISLIVIWKQYYFDEERAEFKFFFTDAHALFFIKNLADVYGK